jgi:hypothetical protein
MSYVIDTSLDAFSDRLRQGDVLAYDTMTPQGGLIQFADRRNVSHVSMYVGKHEAEHMIVDASSRKPKPGEVQRPIRHLALNSQFPLERDKGAIDTVTANRSLVALRHQGFVDSPELGERAAAIAKQIQECQRVSPGDDPWKFSPNDLLVLALPVLTRSFETAYRFAPFVGSAERLIKGMLRMLKWTFEPGDIDYRPGVTCSELAHRILTHKELGLELTAGSDGRQPLEAYVDETRRVLTGIADEDQPEAQAFLLALDWHASSERRAQLGATELDLSVRSGEYDASDLVTPGDVWGFPELIPVAGYELPIRAGVPV